MMEDSCEADPDSTLQKKKPDSRSERQEKNRILMKLSKTPGSATLVIRFFRLKNILLKHADDRSFIGICSKI